MRFINKYRKQLKPLVIAEEHQCFWVNHGPILKDLRELRQALLTMSDEQFHYHVNQHKNDFAKWVEEILQDKMCGRELFLAKTKQAAKKVAEKYLKEYKM